MPVKPSSCHPVNLCLIFMQTRDVKLSLPNNNIKKFTLWIFTLYVTILNSLSQALWPTRTGKTDCHHQNNRCYGGEDLTSTKQLVYILCNLLFQQLCWTKSQSLTVSWEPTVENIHPAMTAQLHLPVHTAFLGSGKASLAAYFKIIKKRYPRRKEG